MAVQLAKLQREEDPRQGPLYRPTPQPMAPQEKSAASQMTDMMANKAMSETVDYGATKLNQNVIQPGLEKASAMFAPAAAAPTMSSVATPLMTAGVDAGLANAVAGNAVTGAATNAAATGLGTSAMTALGTAVPYIGAAMLAGKAFGLFSDGGHVGPLYAADGNLKNVNEAVQKNMDRLKFRGLSKALNEKSDSYVRGDQEREGYSESDFKYPRNDRRKMGEMINELNLYGGGMAGPVSQAQYKSAGGPTRGARVDSTGQPFNAASMFKEISNMPNENALIQEVMDKYNVNAYEAAVMIAESQGNQMNQDFLLNTVMEEIFDGPGGHGFTAEKILNSAPDYVKEKHSDYVGPISQIQYKSAGGEAYTVKYGGPLSAK